MDYNINSTIKSLFENGHISRRTYNCFLSQGYETIYDVVSSINTATELLKIRNFGRKSLAEFRPILNKFKDKSNESFIEVVSTESPKEYCCLNKGFKIIEQTENKISNRIKSNYKSAYELHRDLLTDLEKVITVETDLTYDENIQLRELILKYITETIKVLEYNSLSRRPVYSTYKKLEIELDNRINNFSWQERSLCSMSSQLYRFLEYKYQEMRKKYLGYRARAFQEKYLPKFEEMVKYFDLPLSAYSNICPDRYVKKTLNEIYIFNQEFKKVYIDLFSKSDYDISVLCIKHKYPYLLSEQCKFVIQFQTSNHHIPLFYVLYERLIKSVDRIDKIFIYSHGLINNHKHTLAEIGHIFNLSRERIRQLSSKGTTIQRIIHEFQEDLSFYDNLFKLPCISEITDEYLQLSKNEHLSFNFNVFAIFLSIVSNFKLIEFNNHTIAINKESPLANFNINKFISSLESKLKSKFTQDTYISFNEIIENLSDNKELVGFLTIIVAKVYGLKVENEQIVFPENKNDISNILYKILINKGGLMSDVELFNQFKAEYPEHPFTSPLQIKRHILRINGYYHFVKFS